jgi:hypothetical protein
MVLLVSRSPRRWGNLQKPLLGFSPDSQGLTIWLWAGAVPSVSEMFQKRYVPSFLVFSTFLFLALFFVALAASEACADASDSGRSSFFEESYLSGWRYSLSQVFRQTIFSEAAIDFAFPAL